MVNKLFNYKNFSIEDKRKYFLGEVLHTILNKELFKKNEDLKEYIKVIERFEVVNEYKNYLYKSRTLLASRVLKDVELNFTESDLLILIKNHYNYLEKYSNFNVTINTKENERKKEIKKNKNSVLENYLKAKWKDK
ncbi:hypothetical protein [Staphylococcus saprophyticus]|uniref:hypothetical protein n=1 Tax=Staphylococcus saprophyticus TaxID=29385 RepID=UPI000DFCF7AA|nr:hypothetical protein [Staphylococcus saprophyticus]SUM89506.1 Uncharacterised protein [Staphylococcus saprophyticus]